MGYLPEGSWQTNKPIIKVKADAGRDIFLPADFLYENYYQHQLKTERHKEELYENLH